MIDAVPRALRDLVRWTGRCAVASTLWIDVACAQGAASTRGAPVPPGAVARAGFFQVFERLDATAAALIVGSVVILVLLVVRVWMMVRGERPMKVAPARQRPRVADPDPLDAPTVRGAQTNWGHDQNKRAAQARESVGPDTKMPELDMTVTQWSISEVHNAAHISRQANESMGKAANAPPSTYQTAFNPYYRGDEPTGAGIEVVEVADTLLQAELLVQLGDPKQAMTLLSNHIRDTAKPGPAVWLMLLNLYQSTGRKAQYEALATGFKTLFNASVPEWSAKRDAAARQLESYSQVMARLHTAWGKPDVRPLVEGLLGDDRGGSRQGFSLAAYRDLLFLLEILNELDAMTEEETEREEIQRKLGRIA